MKGPANQPMPCPRCGAQVTGDFKFCPTCAYRLRSDASAAPDLPPPPSRWAQGILGLILGGLVVATVVVGFRLFRDPVPVVTDGDSPPRDPIEGILGVHDIPRLMVNLPPADLARWPRPEDPSEDVPVAVPYWSRVLSVEVTRGMYAEFVRACEEDPTQLPAFLEELWRPPPTSDLLASAARLAYTNDYVDWWWSMLAANLESRYAEEIEQGSYAVERPRGLEAPLPSDGFGMLLLVPPSWISLGPFEELVWDVPEGTENLPVAEISWYEAVGFAQWTAEQLGIPELRLPLMGEWVRAGNAGEVGQRFPWGDDARRYACNSLNYWRADEAPRALPVDWIYSDADGRTREGLFAMSGNVREWTHNNEFVYVQTDGTPRYLVKAPQGLEDDLTRAPALGGSFEEGIDDCTVDLESRKALEKHGRWRYVGFRLWMNATWM